MSERLMNFRSFTVLPSIVNAGIFTAAFSAANSIMFAATRVLYGIGLRGLAPKIFARCTKGGLPIAAVATASLFPFLAYMAIEKGTGIVFQSVSPFNSCQSVVNHLNRTDGS